MRTDSVRQGSGQTGSLDAWSSRTPTVLIVAGASLPRAVMTGYLAGAGFEVLEAVDGRQALELAAAHVPDLIVLAGRLPVISGMEVLARLKADDRLGTVPVIVVADTADADHLAEAFRLGAADYVRPPIRADELLARARAAIAAAVRERELERRAGELERTTALLRASTRRLQALALIDELTGAYNRRYLAEQGEQLLSRARRAGKPMAALLVDADGFKAVNDQLGHNAGDEVLRELAAYIDDSLRRGDVFGRWGGDEFLVLAPDTDVHGAAALAARLDEIQVHVPSGDRRLVVGVSVGSALSGDDSFGGLLHRADSALYAVKGARRAR